MGSHLVITLVYAVYNFSALIIFGDKVVISFLGRKYESGFLGIF